VVAETGAVETTAVDVPELKVESKSASKSDSKTDSKKADSTTTTDKAKASTGGGNTNGNGNTSTDNTNNANTGSNTGSGNTNTGGGTNTGSGNTTPTPDPNAGKTYVPEQRIWHDTTYKIVHHEGVWSDGTRVYGYRCNTCGAEFWESTKHDDVIAHGKAEHHGGWTSISHTVGNGWVEKPYDEEVVDVVAHWEIIPEHWE
jgi:hypothetical protein